MDHLEELSAAVRTLLHRQSVRDTVARLKRDIRHSPEAFIWSALDLDALAVPVPSKIKSAWIFVLKGDTPSGAHFHPNSVQHMVVLEGGGDFTIGSQSGRR